MQITSAATRSEIEVETPVYRVSIWTPPMVAEGSWFLDLWELRDAKDVTEVLAWARAELRDGGRFEVELIGYPDHAYRLYGAAPEAADGVIVARVELSD